VVFSLFVFVSLFMFTVGILVGKGLTQARYESALTKKAASDAAQEEHETHLSPAPGHGGGHAPAAPKGEISHGADAKPAAHGDHGAASIDSHGSHKTAQERMAPEPEKAVTKELELIPLKPQKPDWNGSSLKNQKFSSDETEKLLSNPKIRALTEAEELSPEKPDGKNRDLASTASPKRLERMSFPVGNFTVQVASYPNAQDAEDRVRTLKDLGFSHAYFSANQIGEPNGTWYRVWLGYYPDEGSANKSAEILQARGEIKNFIVRKAEARNGTR
jgi:cell division protein FtsN